MPTFKLFFGQKVGSSTLAPSLVTDTDTFFAPAVAAFSPLAPLLYTDTDTFFAPTVAPGAVTLTSSLFTDTDTFFQPTVSTGAVTLTPGVYSDTDTFFQPTVANATTLTPSLFTDTDTFFAPTVTAGAITLTPSIYSDTDTFFAPTVTGGVVTLTPGIVTDTDSFFTPVVAAGVVTLLPTLFTDSDIFYVPTLSSAEILLPTLVTDTDTFFTPALSGGPVTLLPSLVVDTDTTYPPVANRDSTLLATFVTDTDSIPQPVVTNKITLLPSLFTLIDVFFSPVVTGRTVTILPNRYVDTDIFFTPTVQKLTTQGGGGGGNGSIPANIKYATQFTMAAAGLITALQIQVTNASLSAHTRMMLYADIAGVPGALLAQSNVRTGLAVGTVNYALITPYAVVAGTKVWVAIHTDASINVLGNSASGARYNTDLFSDGPSDPYGVTSLDNKKAPVLIVQLSAVNATMTPGLVSDTDTFYAPVVTYSKTLTATYSTAEFQDFFYTPVLANTSQLLPTLFNDTEIFYSPTITAGAVTLRPSFMVSDDATVIAVIGVGDVNVKFPALLVDRDIFGDNEIAATVTPEGANLRPTKITDTDTFYTPEDVSVYHIVDGLTLSAGESIFLPTVTKGSVTLAPSLVVDVDQYWFAQLVQGAVSGLLPQMVQDGDTFYAPVLTGGTRLLLPGLLADTDQFYQTQGPNAQGHSHRVRLRGATGSPKVAARTDNGLGLLGTSATGKSLRGRAGDIELIGDASEAQVELEGNDA